MPDLANIRENGLAEDILPKSPMHFNTQTLIADDLVWILMFSMNIGFPAVLDSCTCDEGLGFLYSWLNVDL